MTTGKTMTMAVLTVQSPPLLNLYSTKININKLNRNYNHFSYLNINPTYTTEKVDKLLADNSNEKWVKILTGKSGKSTSTKQLANKFCTYKKYYNFLDPGKRASKVAILIRWIWICRFSEGIDGYQ